MLQRHRHQLIAGQVPAVCRRPLVPELLVRRLYLGQWKQCGSAARLRLHARVRVRQHDHRRLQQRRRQQQHLFGISHCQPHLQCRLLGLAHCIWRCRQQQCSRRRREPRCLRHTGSRWWPLGYLRLRLVSQGRALEWAVGRALFGNEEEFASWISASRHGIPLKIA